MNKRNSIKKTAGLKLTGVVLFFTGLLSGIIGLIWKPNYEAIWLILSLIVLVAGVMIVVSSHLGKTIDVDYKTLKLIIAANGSDLQHRFPNIKRIYPSFHIEDHRRIPCVDICLSDALTTGLPEFLCYKTDHSKTLKVPIRVIKYFGNAKPQIAKGSFIANANSQGYLGTISCILSSANNPGQNYCLTCNHVLTGGDFQSPGNIGSAVDSYTGTYQNIGTWAEGQMDNTVDAAIISLDGTQNPDPNNVSLPSYSVSDGDCSVTQVALVGAISGLVQPYIIHFDQSIDVDYDNQTVQIDSLITLSIDTNPNNFTPATQKGDSGALVYHATTLQPIAMVIGANDQFTYAVPIDVALNTFPDLNLTINN